MITEPRGRVAHDSPGDRPLVLEDTFEDLGAIGGECDSASSGDSVERGFARVHGNRDFGLLAVAIVENRERRTLIGELLQPGQLPGLIHRHHLHAALDHCIGPCPGIGDGQEGHRIEMGQSRFPVGGIAQEQRRTVERRSGVDERTGSERSSVGEAGEQGRGGDRPDLGGEDIGKGRPGRRHGDDDRPRIGDSHRQHREHRHRGGRRLSLRFEIEGNGIGIEGTSVVEGDPGSQTDRPHLEIGARFDGLAQFGDRKCRLAPDHQTVVDRPPGLQLRSGPRTARRRPRDGRVGNGNRQRSSLTGLRGRCRRDGRLGRLRSQGVRTVGTTGDQRRNDRDSDSEDHQ
ncbi:unannotated protein [freshwater metagenome]|uniref:Unannotated protein n=1 Tax=freshwater metagenome TaxID=449393 RepID=A0A6J6I2R6_9ZZZZ